jgi:hypothetical protein
MATAVTVLRRHPELVSAFVGLSGFVFDDDQPGDHLLAGGAAAGRGVPAFAGYDPADPLIPGFANRWALTYCAPTPNCRNTAIRGWATVFRWTKSVI